MAETKEYSAGEWTRSESGDIDIPTQDWAPFLDSFNRQHQGWRATISALHGERKTTRAINCRLQHITAESTGTTSRLRVAVDCDDGDRVEHDVINPVRLIFKRDATGAHEGLEIVGSDGSITSLRFRVEVRPETLDGVLSL
jgi:hypothetical protein